MDHFNTVKTKPRVRPPEFKAKHAESQRKYRAADPEKFKLDAFNSNLKRLYGITADDYNKMSLSQNHVCKICGCPETATHRITKEVKRLSVDHCHQSGKVRGLLCTACNTSLGMMKENTTFFQNAINYLENQ